MSTDGSETYDNEGVGRSYGAEFLLKAQASNFFGWISYTYSRSERLDRTDDTMDTWRKFDDDQPNNLIALGVVQADGRAGSSARASSTRPVSRTRRWSAPCSTAIATSTTRCTAR